MNMKLVLKMTKNQLQGMLMDMTHKDTQISQRLIAVGLVYRTLEDSKRLDELRRQHTEFMLKVNKWIRFKEPKELAGQMISFQLEQQAIEQRVIELDQEMRLIHN